MEIIVFNQEELSDALAAGCKSICLCDNDYRLSAAADTSFLAIGKVTAVVSTGRAECERLNMRFLNFEPKYLNQAPVVVPLKYSGVVNTGSFASSSFASSYRVSGSYTLAGSYRLVTSYAASYTTSYRFASSYNTSFASSFVTSFRPSSSFKGNGRTGSAKISKSADNGYIPVFGYGIDLI